MTVLTFIMVLIGIAMAPFVIASGILYFYIIRGLYREIRR